MSGFIIFIKQLVVLIAGLALIWLVGNSEFTKALNAPVWFIALLCCVIGVLTINAFWRVWRSESE